MPDLSGNLDIALRRDGDRLDVSIGSSRPVTAARVFAGKLVPDVAQQLPMLFSVCATAQAQACAVACEQALGLIPSLEIRRRRALLLHAETVKEHLWRLLLDWPQALGATPAHAPMAQAMRAFLAMRGGRTKDTDPFAPGADLPLSLLAPVPDQVEALAEVAAESVFGMPPARWLEQVGERNAFTDWMATAATGAADLVGMVLRADLASLGRNAVPPLPVLAMSDLSAALSGADADGFVAAPTWQGRPYETTPFARCRDRSLVADLAIEHGNGLLPRLAALLLELADAIVALTDPSQAPPLPELAHRHADGIGLGSADAARGLLVHRVEVADGRVKLYHILAPTEWNFHPHGVVAAGLAGGDLARLADDAELKRRAALYVTAVDPCVAYALSVC
jgi:hypothetical protein